MNATKKNYSNSQETGRREKIMHSMCPCTISHYLGLVLPAAVTQNTAWRQGVARA